ncbi:MAG: RNA polymerase sigma factor [Candidatus Gracilibacteria bacterium]|nr:RNA polymerase sigma factor [Candidatus Gracilibacteria bacterium]
MDRDYSEFEGYYNEYKDSIYSYLYYRSGRNNALAEDLTSEIFMKALQKFDSYQPDKSFKSWIYAIAHNHLIDHYRKNRTTVDLTAVENIIESESDDVKSMLNRRIASEQMTELLQHVSDEEREILLMRFHQGLPTKEIADIVDRDDGNVRVIIHRALAKLQKQYASTFACIVISILVFSLHFSV